MGNIRYFPTRLWKWPDLSKTTRWLRWRICTECHGNCVRHTGPDISQETGKKIGELYTYCSGCAGAGYQVEVTVY